MTFAPGFFQARAPAMSPEMKPNTSHEKAYLTETEAAAFLAEIGLPVAPASLRKWRCEARRDQPAAVRFGRQIRYARVAILAWAEARLQPATPTLEGASRE